MATAIGFKIIQGPCSESKLSTPLAQKVERWMQEEKDFKGIITATQSQQGETITLSIFYTKWIPEPPMGGD